MTPQQAYRQLSSRLCEIYDEREASNIADTVIEHLSGEKKIDRILNREKRMTMDQQQLLSAYTERLLRHEPLQYVLHEAWFAGMKFYVNKNVLIPRPETEELVGWIVSNSLTTHNSQLTILDIGTGSGCIAIAIKNQLPFAEISACDISEPALNIARQNAELNRTEVNFFKADILQEDHLQYLPAFDIIVSNPPYVNKTEAEEIRPNVSLYEPHAALFVPGEDPLLFYHHIACFALYHLKPNGSLYLEINELLGREVTSLLQSKNFTSIELKKDLQGKDRMLKANMEI